MKNKSFWSTMLSLIASVIVLFALGGITVFADETNESQSEIVASGYCGAEGNEESVSWTLDSNGLLTISGTGKMYDYENGSCGPWKYKKSAVKEVYIFEGVTSIGDFAFDCCESLTSVTIPDSVTSIGGFAFGGCKSLTSVTIPDSVTSIGRCAFDSCYSLASVTIPDSVTSISREAFCDCSSLASVTIPDSVTSIGLSAFRGCTSLTSITIPDSVTSIGDFAFETCTSLTSVTIPDSVTIIEGGAFSDCSSLVSVTIPDSVTIIGGGAFSNCSSLVSVTIPDSVKIIEQSAFYNCTSLTSISIPDSVKSICYGAFEGCTSLASVTFPDSVIYIGDSAFDSCQNLNNVILNRDVFNPDAFPNCSDNLFRYYYDVNYSNSENGIIAGKFRSFGGDVVELTVTPNLNFVIDKVTLTYAGKTVEIIPDVNGKYKYTMPDTDSATISATFKAAEIIASGYCGADGNGENVSWTLDSTGLLNICGTGGMADYAYSPWNNYGNEINTVVISEDITSIGGGAFSYCTLLTSVIIPDSVTSIGSGAFYNCTSLTSITIPDSVTSIGYASFSGCSSLASITIPDSEIRIGGSAFDGCSNLNSVVINRNAFNYYAFPNCSDNLFHYYYDVNYSNSENGTVSGKQRSFGGDEVEFTVIPSLNFVIDKVTLTYAGKTVEIIPDANGKYKYTMPDTDSATISATFKAPETIASGYCGAEGNEENVSWTLYKTGLLTISGTGEMADDYNNVFTWDNYRDEIKTVVISEGVTNIGRKAFIQCYSLVSVTIPDSVTSIGGSAFSNCFLLASVTIPDSVTSIGDWAFDRCTLLTSVTIPDSVTSIGESAFSNCFLLASVTIPDSVTSIGDWAFAGCANLTSVIMPKRVTSFGYAIFSNCKSLTSIEIPDGVTSIEWRTFADCSSLTSITIPDSVTCICNWAFIGCYRLEWIDIPSSVTLIEEEAFGNCEILTDVYFRGSRSQWDSITIYIEWEDTVSDKTIEDVFGDANIWFDDLSIIKTQPDDFYGPIGSTAVFSVEAYNEIEEYQWQFYLDDDWTDFRFESATTSQLAFEVTEETAGLKVRCVVKDVTGFTDISEEACVVLIDELNIIKQPEDLTCEPGEMAEFSVEAEGNGLKYQWQVLKTTGWTNCSINDGAKTPVLSLEAKDSRNGSKYQCVITDKYGFSVVSDDVVLTVAKPLEIKTQPEDYSGALGETATFTVVAQGVGLKYQWQILKNGGWTNCSTKDGAKTATLSLAIKDSRNGSIYQCVITDKNGDSIISDAVTLTVSTPLSIKQHPVDVSGSEGKMAIFTVVAEGSGLKYQWQVFKNGAWTNCSVNDGAKTDTLSLEIKSSRDGSRYHCVVTDKTGASVTSNEVTMTVANVLIVISQDNTNELALEGEMAEFTCEAYGTGLKYQWQVYKNGKWTNCSINDGAKTDTLTLEAKMSRNGLQYRCVVSDKFGNEEVSEPITLNVIAFSPDVTMEDVDACVSSDYVVDTEIIEEADAKVSAEVVEVTEVVEVAEVVETVPEAEVVTEVD